LVKNNNIFKTLDSFFFLTLEGIFRNRISKPTYVAERRLGLIPKYMIDCMIKALFLVIMLSSKL